LTFSVVCLANSDDVDVDGLGMAVSDLVLGAAANRLAPSWGDPVREDALAT